MARLAPTSTAITARPGVCCGSSAFARPRPTRTPTRFHPGSNLWTERAAVSSAQSLCNPKRRPAARPVNVPGTGPSPARTRIGLIEGAGFMHSDHFVRVVMYHYVRDFPRTAFPKLNGMLLDDFRHQVSELSSHFEMA